MEKGIIVYVNHTLLSSVDRVGAIPATSSATGATMISNLICRNIRKRVRDAVRHFLEAIDN